MFKVSHPPSPDVSTSRSCLPSVDEGINGGRCTPRQADQAEFERLSSLNQLAIRCALSGQYFESMQCFETAFSLLVEMRLTRSDIRLVASMKHMPTAAVAEEGYFDERLEYDEGWNLSFSSMSFENFGPSTPWNELAASLLYNIGQVLLLQRRFSFARDVFVDACALARSVSTENSHLLILPILHLIGYLQYWHREITAAIETYQMALKLCEALQPEQTLRIASTLNCLGVLHFHLPVPEVEKSREFLLLALDLQMKTLGPEDGAVATTLNNLGRVHFTSEHFDLALEVYEEALRIRKKLLGDEHVDVAATMYNCGQTLQRMGKASQALDCYSEFVNISMALRRPNRYLVVALKCIATVYQDQQDYKEALKYYNQALTLGLEILGVHADIAAIFNKIGNLLYQMGDANTAIQMYEQGLGVERMVLDPKHPNIAVTLCNIAQIHKQQGNLRSSLRLYEESLSLQRESSDYAGHALAVTLSNIGLIHYQTGEYRLALEKFREVLQIRKEILGEDNLNVAFCLNSIGLVLFKLGLPEMALRSFTESLNIRRKVQGQAHRDAATILHNIATIHLELGNDEEGVRCYKESLRIERMALGPLHDDILSTLECLAKVHQHRGELAAALECFREVLEIRQRKNHNDELGITHTLNIIANLCLQSGDATGAIEAMSTALRIIRNSEVLNDDAVELSGFELYGFSKLHPEAAAAA